MRNILTFTGLQYTYLIFSQHFLAVYNPEREREPAYGVKKCMVPYALYIILLELLSWELGFIIQQCWLDGYEDAGKQDQKTAYLLTVDTLKMQCGK